MSFPRIPALPPEGGALFDPLSALGGLPGFTGGAAGPAVSSNSSGDVSAALNAPFVIGDGNETSGGGNAAALPFSEKTLLIIAVLGLVAWVVVNRK